LSIWSAIILGIVQGLTEYIPVSSTAHLILAQDLGVRGPADPQIAHAFDTIIQFGTLLPVLIYFRAEWAQLLKGLLRVITQGRITRDPHERMAVLVVIASIPALVFGALLNQRVEAIADVADHPAGYAVIGSALIAVGLLMWWIDCVSRKRRTEAQLTRVDAVLVGLAQSVALVPGVSRSGATITAGLLAGLTREAAARFSFLISVPVMLAAVAFKTLKMLRGHAAVAGSDWLALAAGILVAAAVGYLSIAFLLNYLRRHSLGVFAWYRVMVGLFLIGLYVAPMLHHNRSQGSAPPPRGGSRHEHQVLPADRRPA
jgi:undecaprenyl-diphosphatase